MINFLILVLLLLLLAYFTDYFLICSFLGYKYRYFVAPGIIVHELSHALACKLTGAKIAQISFFDKNGGFVQHEPSVVPVLGPILISTAPLIINIIIFYFLARALKLENSLNLQSMIFNFKLILSSVDFKLWWNILIVYLILSMAVTMTPSKQDLINMGWSLAIVVGIFYLVLHFASININRLDFIFSKINPVLNLSVMMLLVCLVISLVFYLVSKLLFRK